MPRAAHSPVEDVVQSTEKIRAAFPALERVHQDVPAAYFDGPGGTQVPRVVVNAVADYLLHKNANTHWAFPTSAETDRALSAARSALADFLNASPNEVGFGLNMTSLTFHLARALGRRWGQGDRIVVTELDHHANIDPWRTLERDRGVEIVQVRMVAETGQLDWDDFERHVSDNRVKLVAIGGASNALGTINDVARAVALARPRGALTFVDAVHYAPHVLVDVRAWDCDFLACSAYKFYGPHVGVLYGKAEHLRSLDFPKLAPAPETIPERLETGTQNHEGIVGTAAAVEFLASLAESPKHNSSSTRRQRLETVFGAFHDRGKGLLTQLWDGLERITGISLYGPRPDLPRTPTLSFTLKDRPAEEVSRLLSTRGIFASHGNFYAMTVAERLGAAEQGLVRLGCACYTTEEETTRVIDAVNAIARGTLH
jgi:cysteine desulfurase family protein (TIGR01976 family)